MAGQYPRYAAFPFVAEGDHVVAGLPVRCMSERAALMCAERLLTVFGNAGSVALRSVVASALYGVKPLDPMVMSAVVLTLAVVGLLAPVKTRTGNKPAW